MNVRRCFGIALLVAVWGQPALAAKPQWTWELPARKPAWLFSSDIAKDSLYVPVAQGNLVLIACEHNGALLAIDRETGAERWRFYTNGPLRVPPLADEERIYLPADDGHLYCLDHSGKLLWKVQGGPSSRKVLAHERISSVWPVNAAPKLADGKIYYAAGVWPVDGVFLHALDAKTGANVWTNGMLQYRPTDKIFIAEGKLCVKGLHGSGTYDLATGASLTDKQPAQEKAPAAKPTGLSANAAGLITFTGDKDGADKKYKGTTTEAKGNTALADAILEAAKTKAGYCIVAGLEDGSLVEGLLKQSKLHIIAIDADAAKVDKIRRRCDDAGLFNDHRLEVLVDDPTKTTIPPYIANLIVSEKEAPIPESVRACQRPHGGVWIERAGGKIAATRREGMPAGAAEWTHEFCDPANTLAVRDKLVKAPLGTLWYGNESTAGKYYYREGMQHPSAEVIDGRLILQSHGLLSAFDMYNGRVLWESPIPKMFLFQSTGIHSEKFPHPVKVPEAHKAETPIGHRCRATGFNMVSTSDGIYLAAGKKLIRFDPTDGKRMSEWEVPLEEKDLCWGNLRAVDRMLIATAFRPQDIIDADAGYAGNGSEWAGDRMPMAYLLAIDRDTGKLLWNRKADWGFLNRAGVAIGGGRVYCIDLLLEETFPKFQQAGRKFPTTPPMLYALDLKTGKEVWSRPLEYRAKGLVYSVKRDILVVPCRNKIEWKNGEWVNAKKAKLQDALKGNMRGITGATGKLLWEVDDEPYNDPPLLLDDLIVSRAGVTFDLTTGNRHERTSPITGKPEQWSFAKAGCNHLIGCDALFTWRTGFFDLAGGTGSMPLREMEAGCTPTLIPSGGILNIPNSGGTFEHRLRARMVAMALVHVPDNPFWAVNSIQVAKGAVSAPIARAGFQFGAPGNRKADDGTLWLGVDAKSKEITVKGEKLEWFEMHPAQTGDWLGSSGVIGASEIAVPTTTATAKPKGGGSTRKYDVKLHFIEPRGAKPGERIFSVTLEGKPALQDFDVAKEAAGSLRRVVREFKDVDVDGILNIQLIGKAGQTVLSGVELIAK